MTKRTKKAQPRKRTRKAAPGYEALPGSSRSFRDLATGEVLPRRQYDKRIQQIRSYEAKAKENRKRRAASGEPQPMKRYNAVVDQYRKVYGKGIKVRGNSKEALEFQKAYQQLIKRGSGKAHRRMHLRACEKLGIITHAEYERYSEQND
jgi:hypothetical protein